MKYSLKISLTMSFILSNHKVTLNRIINLQLILHLIVDKCNLYNLQVKLTELTIFN